MAWPNVQSSDTPGISNYVWDTGTLSWIKLTSTMLGGGGAASTSVTIDGGTLTTLTGGNITVSNPTTAVTVTNPSTAVTITNPSTSVSIGGSSGIVNTLSSGPVLIGTSTAVMGRVVIHNTTSTGPTNVLGPSTASIGRVTVENTTATGPTNVLGASTATIGRISSSTSEIGSFTLLNPTTSVSTLSSGPILLGTSTANIGWVDLDTSTSEIGRVVISTAGAMTPTYITAAAASKVSTSPGTVWWISAYTTSTGTFATALPGFIRIHNTITSSSTGATVVWSAPIAVVGTSTGGSLQGSWAGGDLAHNFGPRGLSLSSACTVDVTTLSTNVTALANAKITVLYG